MVLTAMDLALGREKEARFETEEAGKPQREANG